MQRILLFLYSLRALILFIVLELVAAWFIFSYNSVQGAVFFNSSNRLAGGLLDKKEAVVSYFYLGVANEALAEKNAQLLKKLEDLSPRDDSVTLEIDTLFRHSYEFWSAKVINNSIHLNQNHITLNKGSNHGIREGMGVFNELGVVGRVKGVSRNFSTVISALHTDLLISSKIKGSNVFGSTNWDGKNPKSAKLLYVPRHVNVQLGDSVVTSGYNAIFPEGMAVGFVSEVKPGSESAYLEISLELSTDFSKLTYVYLVDNTLKEELDSLQLQLDQFYDGQ
ncbi:rod shape-determining protein MreC [Pleomorphovibrio marinus]|uniref:rod shape-determining protein MreC n=1 Tax=Pleomorphovibrio marinus TaxID=2164132 RepID=UPI000E0AB192|nr:rod shape-determining protein MreC [Pleomorphovibrio marinus]